MELAIQIAIAIAALSWIIGFAVSLDHLPKIGERLVLLVFMFVSGYFITIYGLVNSDGRSLFDELKHAEDWPQAISMAAGAALATLSLLFGLFLGIGLLLT